MVFGRGNRGELTPRFHYGLSAHTGLGNFEELESDLEPTPPLSFYEVLGMRDFERFKTVRRNMIENLIRRFEGDG